MLKRVQFGGIQSLLDVTLGLEPFTVLVGPNGSGKSAVLNEIERVCMMTTLPSGRDPRGGPGRVLLGADLEGLSTRIEPPVAMSWEFELPDTAGLSVRISPGPMVSGLDRVTFSILGGDASRSFARKLLFDGPIGAQRLRLEPGAVAAPSPVQHTRLQPSGYGLATVLHDLAGQDPEAYATLQTDMRAVVPHVEGLTLDIKVLDSGEPACTFGLVLRRSGPVPASRLSDGTLLTLVFLTAIHNRRLPPLILMDDLDRGLHPSALSALVQAIRRVMVVRPELQIVATTHSPILLDSFAIDEVRVLTLDSEGRTRVKPLAQHPRLDDWRKSFGAGELWANLGEEWVVERS